MKGQLVFQKNIEERNSFLQLKLDKMRETMVSRGDVILLITLRWLGKLAWAIAIARQRLATETNSAAASSQNSPLTLQLERLSLPFVICTPK